MWGLVYSRETTFPFYFLWSNHDLGEAVVMCVTCVTCVMCVIIGLNDVVDGCYVSFFLYHNTVSIVALCRSFGPKCIFMCYGVLLWTFVICV